jgi:hypothetical protein
MLLAYDQRKGNPYSTAPNHNTSSSTTLPPPRAEGGARPWSPQVDDKDRPKEPIVINRVSIFVNPYAEDEEEAVAAAPEEEEAEPQRGSWYSNPNTAGALPVHKKGIGMYIAPAAATAKSAKPAAASDSQQQPPPAKKPKPTAGGFGNFDAW